MSGVKQWLVSEAERVAALPCLEDALFGFGARRYAFYRLRYTFIQALLRTALRVIELGLFVNALPLEVLSSVLVFRSAMVVGEGLWWGALETLRRDVRVFFAQSRLGLATQRVRQWLALSVCLGAGVLSCGGLWVWLGPSPFKSFSVVDAYLLGCCVRWGTDVWAATYHAGVYGVRRVYRPVWSLVLLDLADVALLGVAFVWLGIWGLALSLVVVGVLRALAVWGFTRRVYRGFKLDAGLPKLWFRALWRKPVWALRHSAEHALGNLVGQIDALIVLGLIAAPGDAETTLVLAALFHVVAPLQTTASVWSRLFYFDFKRLEAWGSPFLLSRFEVYLARASWWVPLPIGVVTLLLMAAFWRGPYVLLACELMCLAAVRARLSLVHIRAYSMSDHRFLRRLLFLMLAVAAGVPFVAHLPPELALGAVVVLMALGLVLLGRSQQPLTARTARGLLEPSIWLRQLLLVNEPVYLGLARVDRRLSTVGRLGRAIRQTNSDAALARLSNDTVAWFSSEPVTQSKLLTHGAGTVQELRLGAAAATGRQALDAGLEGATWQRHLGSLLLPESEDAVLDLPTLARRLQEVHSEARVVKLDDRATFNEFSHAGSRELRRLLLDATRGDTHFRRVGEYEISVFAPAGQPLALLVVPRRMRPPNEWKGALAAVMERTSVAWTLRYTP